MICHPITFGTSLLTHMSRMRRSLPFDEIVDEVFLGLFRNTIRCSWEW